MDFIKKDKIQTMLHSQTILWFQSKKKRKKKKQKYVPIEENVQMETVKMIDFLKYRTAGGWVTGVAAVRSETGLITSLTAKDKKTTFGVLCSTADS